MVKSRRLRCLSAVDILLVCRISTSIGFIEKPFLHLNYLAVDQLIKLCTDLVPACEECPDDHSCARREGSKIHLTLVTDDMGKSVAFSKALVSQDLLLIIGKYIHVSSSVQVELRIIDTCVQWNMHMCAWVCDHRKERCHLGMVVDNMKGGSC